MKKFSKVLSMVLALTMLFGLFGAVNVGAQDTVTVLTTTTYSRAEGQTMEAYLASLAAEGIISDIASGTEYPEDGSAFFSGGGSSNQKTAFKLVSKLGYRYDVDVKVKSKEGTLGESGKQYVRIESGSKCNWDNHLKNQLGNTNYPNTGRADLILDEATGWYDLSMGFTIYSFVDTSITSTTCSLNFKEVQPSGSTPIGFYAKDLVITESRSKTYSNLDAAAETNKLAVDGQTKITASAVNAETSAAENIAPENLSFSSENEDVVSVDANGNVKALAEGTADVTVKFGSEDAGYLTDTLTFTVSKEGAITVTLSDTYSRAEGQTMAEYFSALGEKEILYRYSPDTVFPEDSTDSVLFPGGDVEAYKATDGFSLYLKTGYSYDVTLKAKAVSGTAKARFYSGSKCNWVNDNTGSPSTNYINTSDANVEINSTEWYDLGMKVTISSDNTDSRYGVNFYERQPNAADGTKQKTVGLYVKDLVITESKDVTYSGFDAAAVISNIPVDAETKITASAVNAENSATDVIDSKYLSFENANEDIVSVDANGNIKALATGTAVVTVKFGNETAGYLTDTVTFNVTSVADYKNELHVALSGSDDLGDGSLEKPFRTIEMARNTIRSYYSLPEGGVTVYIHGGVYEISKTIEFDERDSGTKENPIVYTAYNNEEVSFIGGKYLNTSAIQKVEDETVLNRLVDKNARTNLYMLDLGAQGIEMDDLEPYGWGSSKQNYKPMRIYMNNTLLTNARWPNDDQSQWALKMKPIDYEGGQFNAANQPAKLQYPDPENRTSKWQTVKSGDAHIGGAIVHFWSSTHLLIDSVDTENKIVTTTDGYTFSLVPGAHYGQRYAIYFSNIFEEIDVPGESYVDRENDILYFYPIGKIDGAEMMVSTLKENMIKATNTDYVTFSGIDFKDTVETPVSLNSCDNLTIEYSEIANGSRDGIEMTDCTNTTIYGCHIFSLGNSALKISGGDRSTLKPSGNLIQNNSIHNVAQLPHSRLSRAAIQVSGCAGEVISHNEFTDLSFGALDIGSSHDIVFEYNVVKNAELQTTDAGAIYWGRQVDSLGHTIRFNYFENIGSKQFTHVLDGSEGSGPLFMDDATTGGNIYGNVTFDAGSKRGAFVANGAEYTSLHNNIIIFEDTSRTSYSFRIRAWGNHEKWEGVNENIPFSAYLYHTRMRDLFGGSIADTGFNEAAQSRMWSEEWRDKYEGTQWQRTLELYSKENYEAIKKLYEAKDQDGIVKYMNEHFLNEPTNTEYNNVALGVTADFGGNGKVYDNYVGNAGGVTAEEKAMFVDYEGRDFTLTDAGLAKIRTQAPGFEPIPFNEIGLIKEDVGHRPSVTLNEELISGIPAAGSTIAPSYTFSDADGDLEGKTVVYWYSSNTKNGKYTMLEGKAVKHLDVTADLAGKYLKYEIVPYDTNMLRGESVMSDAISVRRESDVNVTELSAAIAEAESLASNAVIGTENGNYAQSAVDKLQEAIANARTVALDKNAVQYEVDNATEALKAAIELFKISDILDLEFTGIGDMMSATDKWYVTKGTPENTGSKITLKSGDQLTYTGEKFLNTIFTFKMKLVPDSDTYTAINAEDYSPDINGVGFKVRRDNEKAGDVWSDSGYLIWLKNLTYELQEYNPSKTIFSYSNNVFTEFNKEYEVALGAYDVGGIARFVLYVDGTKIGDVKYSDKLVGQSGYFTMRGPSNAGLTVEITASEADYSKLDEAIAAAEDFLKNAPTGTGYNQYTEENKAVLAAEIAAAKALKDNSAVQIEVDRKIIELDRAIKDLKATSGTEIDVASKSEVEINYEVPEAEINATKNVAVDIVLDKESKTPEITATTATDNGIASVTIPKGSTLSGSNWNGKITNPVYSEIPSATVSASVTVDAVYKTGESVVETDNPARFVFPGAKSKKVYYLNESGKYVEVTKRINEDSLAKAKETLDGSKGAVKMNVGNDLVVYSSYITEFIICSNAAADDEDGGYNGGISSVGGAGAGGGGIGGFFSTSTTTPSADVTNNFVFSDMTNHWARADVMSMYNAGIVTGVTATTFEPDRAITRAEFATLIAKGLKLTLETTNDFADVAAADWFAPYVGAAAKAGIIVGADGKFRPNDTITREEMAVIVVKAYEYLGKEAVAAEIKFADNDNVSNWAKEYVAKAVGAGLISGMGDGTFGPKENATRAQSASLISRILK